LRIRISIGPSCASTSRTSLVKEPESVRSATKARASAAPAAIARRQTSSSRGRRLAAAAIFTPSCARASATASPTPDLAPLTTATLPLTKRSIRCSQPADSDVCRNYRTYVCRKNRPLRLPQVEVGAVQPVLPRRIEDIHVERVLQGLRRVRQVGWDEEHFAGA